MVFCTFIKYSNTTKIYNFLNTLQHKVLISQYFFSQKIKCYICHLNYGHLYEKTDFDVCIAASCTCSGAERNFDLAERKVSVTYEP